MLLAAGSSAIDVLLACSYGGRVAWWLAATCGYDVVDDSAHGHGWLFARADTCWRESSQSRLRVDRCPVVPVMRGHVRWA